MLEYALDDDDFAGFRPLEVVNGESVINVDIQSVGVDHHILIRSHKGTPEVECTVSWISVEPLRSHPTGWDFRLTIVGARLPASRYLTTKILLSGFRLRVVVLGNRTGNSTSERAMVVSTPRSAEGPVSTPSARASSVEASETDETAFESEEDLDPGADREERASKKPLLAILALALLLLGAWGARAWFASRQPQTAAPVTGGTIAASVSSTPQVSAAPPSPSTPTPEPSQEPAVAVSASPTPTPEPEPAPASLSVTSKPAGGKVFVDGAARGTTPLQLKDLHPHTEVTVKVIRAGYLAYSTSVKLGESGESTVSAVLKATPKPKPEETPSPHPAPGVSLPRPLRPGYRSSWPVHKKKPAPKKAPAPHKPHKRRRRRLSALDAYIHQMATEQK